MSVFSGGLAGPFAAKISQINWIIVTLVAAIGFIGLMMQFSVGNADWTGQPIAHGLRFAGLLLVAIVLAVTPIRFWMVIAYPLWILGVVMVLAIRIPGLGVEGGGAVLWLKLGPVTLQPSEIMKIAVILSLARFYNGQSLRQRQSFLALIGAAFIVFVPAGLVAIQPDLGTAALIALAGLAVMFMAGLRWRYIVPAVLLGIGGALFAYQFLLEDYQRLRIQVFLGLAEDDRGAGYNILQSKIAIGAAGLTGEGFSRGSQSQLDYLPEKHTDFIFTMIVEEFGSLGGALVLFLYLALMGLLMNVSTHASSMFGKFVAGGVAAMLASYVFINTAMVQGLVPVVGVPLPFISYGGSAMATMMIGIAIVLSADLHKDDKMAMRGLLW